MFRLDLGSTNRYCDGLSRRSFLQLGVAGLASVGLPALLRARESSKESLAETKNTSVILIWLDGGPTHLDMYDLKPEAPAEYRGTLKPIRTNVPGIDICEYMPEQAKVMDKLAIVRSMSHTNGNHPAAAYWMKARSSSAG